MEAHLHTQSNVYISTDPLDRRWIDVNIPCQAACPIMTNIPGYIQAIMQGDYETAYKINRLDNVLPGSLGRICHRPCEGVCRHGRDGLGDPVSICFLKRSAADYGMVELDFDIRPNGKSVCIVGSGPAGLTAANDLAIRGYQVTILEQLEHPGGMLRYGIPQFRLPYDIVEKDIRSIERLGVKIMTNHRVEGESGFAELRKQYDAVILAAGCMKPKHTDIPGIEAEGVYWGLDFIMQANQELIQPDFQKVVVIGGGFTAVDCARMAYRLGAEEVTLAYRRTRDRMYIGEHEFVAMEEEGIQTTYLVSPIAIEERQGKIAGIRMVQNKIDHDGNISPIPGSEFFLEADAVIFAIGQNAEELLPRSRFQAEGNFFIAGDHRNGPSTVIEAAADGRKVARKVHQKLSGIKGYQEVVYITPADGGDRTREDDFIPRQKMDETPLTARREKNREVELGYSPEKSRIEARRCYLCHYNYQIDIERCIYCLACIDVMPVDGCIKMVADIEVLDDGTLRYIPAKNWDEVNAIAIDNDLCIRCGNCYRACPVECITISKYVYDIQEVR